MGATGCRLMVVMSTPGGSRSAAVPGRACRGNAPGRMLFCERSGSSPGRNTSRFGLPRRSHAKVARWQKSLAKQRA